MIEPKLVKIEAVDEPDLEISHAHSVTEISSCISQKVFSFFSLDPHRLYPACPAGSDAVVKG